MAKAQSTDPVLLVIMGTLLVGVTGGMAWMFLAPADAGPTTVVIPSGNSGSTIGSIADTVIDFASGGFGAVGDLFRKKN